VNRAPANTCPMPKTLCTFLQRLPPPTGFEVAEVQPTVADFRGMRADRDGYGSLRYHRQNHHLPGAIPNGSRAETGIAKASLPCLVIHHAEEKPITEASGFVRTIGWA